MLFHALLQPHAHVDRHVNHDAGIALGETLQNARQQPFADILRRAEPHDAAKLRHDKPRHRFVRQRQDVTGIGQQHLAVARQRYRAGVAQKQRCPQLFFKLLDLHRHRRWRAEDCLCGGRKIARLGDGNKGAQYIVVEQRNGTAKGYAHRRIFQFF